MQIKPAVSFYHDCRRALKNGKYPVKVRVTFQVMKLGEYSYPVKYAKTGVSLSQDEFTAALSAKVPAKLQRVRQRLLDREKEVNEIIDKHPGISPELFESISSGQTVSRAGRAGMPIPFPLRWMWRYSLTT